MSIFSNALKIFSERTSVRKQLLNVSKQLKIAMDGIVRPFGGSLFGNQSGVVYPPYPYGRDTFYELSYNSDVLTTVHNSLRRELFRNGFEVAESTDVDDIDEQEEYAVVASKREEIIKFLKNVNENNQSIIDVLMEIEDDFSIRDDGFMLFIFEYAFDNKGKVISKESILKQIIRADPRYMGLIMNKYDRPGYNDQDEELFSCVVHRGELLVNNDVCPQCGKKCFRAHYFTDHGSTKIYYFKNEVVHRSKYRPSKRFGQSPVLTVWQKTRSLMFMDKYIMEMYDGQRPPKAGLFFKTSNDAALKKMWESAKQRADENPHLPIVMGVPDTSNGKGFVEFIDFMRSLNELQYTEMRNEFARKIGSVYGVMPLFQGDMSQGGGLNNEGMEVTVTNRASEYGQAIYNQHYFPPIMKAIGAVGWQITLNPSEEQDEKAKLEREQLTLNNGKLAMELGLEAEYSEETGEVAIKEGKLELKEVEPGFAPPETSLPQGPTGSGSPETFNKMLELSKARPPFSKMSETLKKEIDFFIKKFKKKPEEAEMNKIIAKINLQLENELRESSKGLFKKIYMGEADKTAKQFGVNAIFDVVDQNALVVLSNQDVLSKAYSGVANNLTKKLNDIIGEAFRTPKGLNTQQIIDKIKDAASVSDFRAETIARVETSKVASAARLNTYRKESNFDTFKFRHTGPADHRTTDTSKRIKERTKNGVSWGEYVDIVTQESAKDFPDWTVNKDSPVSHYNSRHLPLRAV